MFGRVLITNTYDTKFSEEGLFYSFLGLAVILGAFLRIYLLPDQIILDDEMHALHALANHSYLFICTHFFPQNISTPLALIYKATGDMIGLNEFTMRLPTLLTGIAIIIVLPLFLKGILNASSALICAYLLAISPILINYSRIARPYSIVVFLVMVSIFSFYRWLLENKTRWALTFVISSILSLYFHFLCAPAIFATGAFGLLKSIRKSNRTQGNPQILYIFIMGCVILIGISILVSAQFWSSSGVLLGKTGGGHISIATIKHGLVLMLGIGNNMLLYMVIAGILAGVVIVFKRNRGFALFLIFVIAFQALSIMIICPSKVQYGHIFARYNLWSVPLFLLFLSVSLNSLKLPVTTWLRTPIFLLTNAIILSLLFFMGPIPKIYYTPNNFLNSNIFTDIEIAPEFTRYGLNRGRISSFYMHLGKSDQPFSIVETLWYFMSPYNRLPIYQRFHRKNVVIGFVSTLVKRYTKSEVNLDDRQRYSFKHFVDVTKKENVLGRGVRYIILHKNIQNEPCLHLNKTAIDVTSVILQLNADYGDPVFEDRDIMVFSVGDEAV